MLSGFITFLPRSKHLLISWLQSPSAVILETKKIKPDTVFPSICHEGMKLDALIFVFLMLSFKPTFSPSSFTLIKRLFNLSSLFAIRVALSAYLRLLIFLFCPWNSPGKSTGVDNHSFLQGDLPDPWIETVSPAL